MNSAPALVHTRVVTLKAAPPPVEEEGDSPQNPFPLESLPPALKEMTEHASRNSDAPVSLCAAAGLGVLSAALGAGIRAASAPGRFTFGNLFILSFAQSGTGKGLAFNEMAGPYIEEGIRRLAVWRDEMRPVAAAGLEAADADLQKAKQGRKSATDDLQRRAAAEELTEAQKLKSKAEHLLSQEPLLNLGQCTAEALGLGLSLQPGEAAAILSSEGRDIIDNLLGRYSKSGKSSDEAIYLQSYSGDPVTIRRLSRPPITLRHPRLTLCVSIQPDIWRRISAEEKLMESGFLARCLLFDSRARPVRPTAHSVPESVKNRWSGLLLELLTKFHDQPEECATVAPEPEALAVLNALAHESADRREEGGEWAGIAPFAARLAENAWRLSLVLHAAEHGERAGRESLSVSTATAAVTVARWFFTETLALLAPVSTSKLSARLEKLKSVFAQRGEKRVALRDLKNSHGFDRRELEILSGAFPRVLRIHTAAPSASGGRPSPQAEVGPFPASA